jgi:putative chitinase
MTIEEILIKFYPNSKKDYIRAITSTRGLELLKQHDVLDSPFRLCHFLAQCAQETGGFRITHESGNYSAKRLLEIFPKYFNKTTSNDYVGRPESILSRAYANRLGNGDEASGDGWRYRGRGFLQETGRENYQRRSQAAGVDLVANPDLAANPEISLKIALDRWSRSKLNSFADEGPTPDAIRAVSRGINLGDPNAKGTPHGLADREAQFFTLWSAFKDLRLTPETKIDTLASGSLESNEVLGSAAKAKSDGKLEGFLSSKQQERLAAALNKHLGIPLLFDEEQEQQVFIKIVQSIDRHIYSVVPKEITDAIKNPKGTVSGVIIEGLKTTLVTFLADRVVLPFLPLPFKSTILSYAVGLITDALMQGTSIDELLDEVVGPA